MGLCEEEIAIFDVKQSTALTFLIFAFDSNGDPVNGLADGSWTKRISKNGGAWAALTITLSFTENGWYSVPMSTAHSDTLGILSMTFTATGVKQINVQFRVTTRILDDLAYPAVSGRSTAVAATGHVGLDWANIAAPTTAQGLTGTTIATSQVVASVSGAVGSVGANGIARASFAADTGLQTIRSGTAQAGTSTSITLDASASATNDFYNNSLILITGGTGVGQAPRRIRDYTGSSKVADVARAWITNPDNTSTFAIIPDVSVWDEFAADHVTANTFGAIEGQSLTLPQLLDELIGPTFTVVAHGSNSQSSFQIDVTAVTELDADWWKGAFATFDLTANVGGQYRKATAYNLVSSFITVDAPYTRIPTAGSTGRMEYR